MTINTALLLAENDNPASNSEGMELANQYFRQINPNSWETVFPQADIQLCKFYEQANLTQRERDMIYIVSFLNQCYSELHITVLTLGEPLSLASIERLNSMFDKLQQYNLTNILLNGTITDDEFIKIMVEQK